MRRHRFLADLLAYGVVAIAVGAGVAIYFFSPSPETVQIQSPTVDFSFEGNELPEKVMARFEFVNRSYRDVEVTSGAALCDCMTPGVPVLVPRFDSAEVNVVVETNKMSFPAERRIRFYTNPQIPGLNGVVRFTRVPAGVSNGEPSGNAEPALPGSRNSISHAEPQSVLESATGSESKNNEN